jgi:hypothetical protein
VKEEFKKIIFEALHKARTRNLNIYTFALYHDHESHVASVCIDTIESSAKLVRSSNNFVRAQFKKAIEENNLKSAKSWMANGGRSFSLGDYAFVNASEIDVPPSAVNSTLYLNMVKAIEEMRDLIEMQSHHGCNLLYCCSTESEEVGLIWS